MQSCDCKHMMPVMGGSMRPVGQVQEASVAQGLAVAALAVGAGYASLRYGAKLPHKKAVQAIAWYGIPAAIVIRIGSAAIASHAMNNG